MSSKLLESMYYDCCSKTINLDYQILWTTSSMKVKTYISILMQAMISSYLQTYLHVVRGKEAFGTFTENLQKTRNILSVLCTFIQTTETSALICLGDQSGSSAITVLSQDSSMYIFDPHSRNISGTAFCTWDSCTDAIQQHTKYSFIDL